MLVTNDMKKEYLQILPIVPLKALCCEWGKDGARSPALILWTVSKTVRSHLLSSCQPLVREQPLPTTYPTTMMWWLCDDLEDDLEL